MADSPHSASRLRDMHKSTERRLRKMSHDYQPNAFSFAVQAQILCVGMAVVYRLSINLTTKTTSLLARVAMDDGARASGTSSREWVIAMSQSKFRAFYSQVSGILSQPAMLEYLTRSDAKWKPFDSFLLALTETLHRFQHLRSAFEIQANADMMRFSKASLESFLTDCWSALEIIVPHLAVEPHLPAFVGRDILSLYVLMRDFLAFPESILEANWVYAQAILSLEDVEELLPQHFEHCCSICLESLVESSMQALSPDLSKSRPCPGTQECACEAVACDSKFSVRLPCTHVFHENCIMAWLRHNPSCPVCRSPVGLLHAASS